MNRYQSTDMLQEIHPTVGTIHEYNTAKTDPKINRIPAIIAEVEKAVVDLDHKLGDMERRVIGDPTPYNQPPAVGDDKLSGMVDHLEGMLNGLMTHVADCHRRVEQLSIYI